MHRDKKFGMALGVLLVGIVAAFFFRNERTPMLEAPQLLDPQALDSRIAERPLGPYLTGVETIDDPPPPNPLRDDPAGSRPKPDTPGPAPIPDRRGFAPLARPAGGATSASGPIPFPGSSAANSPSRRYPHNDAWEAVSDPNGKPADRPDVEEPFRPGEVRVHRVHRVQPGDTLSGLAVRYLGSSARFHEIYLANRDVLRSPDDLRVGMTLKIPAERESRSSSQGVEPRRTVSDEPPSVNRRSGSSEAQTRNASSGAFDFPPFQVDGPREVEKPRTESPAAPAPLFRPARRNPFMPRGTDERSSRADDAIQPVKTLSQAPPAHLPPLDDAARPDPRMTRE